MVIYLCEDSFDGILTGVYDIYADRVPLSECRLELQREYEPRLFVEYVECPIDPVKAEKVVRKIRSSMSEEAFLRLYRTALHKSPERAENKKTTNKTHFKIKKRKKNKTIKNKQ